MSEPDAALRMANRQACVYGELANEAAATGRHVLLAVRAKEESMSVVVRTPAPLIAWRAMLPSAR